MDRVHRVDTEWSQTLNEIIRNKLAMAQKCTEWTECDRMVTNSK